MPAPISTNIKLKLIVLGYIEASKQSESEFLRLWRICFTGFKQMGLNAFWEPKTWVLPVTPSKVAFWPQECLQWIKIGQFNWNGELQTLRINEDLTVFHADLDNRLSDIMPEIGDCAGALQSDLWFNGFDYFYGNGPSTATDRPFGLHSRLIQNGECVVDEKNRLIALNPDYPYSEVVMEGLCSPEEDDDYAIPMQFEQAMKAWLGWQDIAYLPSTNHVQNNTIMMRGKMFKSQCMLAKKMFKPFRLQDAYQEAIESMMLAPKP